MARQQREYVDAPYRGARFFFSPIAMQEAEEPSIFILFYFIFQCSYDLISSVTKVNVLADSSKVTGRKRRTACCRGFPVVGDRCGGG